LYEEHKTHSDDCGFCDKDNACGEFLNLQSTTDAKKMMVCQTKQ